MSTCAAWLGNLVLTISLCGFVAACVAGTLPFANPLAWALAFASMVCIAAPLLLPRTGSQQSVVMRLLWTGTCAGAAGALIAIATDIDAQAIARLVLGVAVLTFVVDATRLWGTRWLDARAAAAWTTALVVALFALPLIAGPLAQANAEHGWLVNGIISVSPLSHLAAQLDYDYLRAPWFYQHSQFGGLRFEYPPASFTTAVLFGIAAVSEGARRHFFTLQRNTPSCTV